MRKLLFILSLLFIVDLAVGQDNRTSFSYNNIASLTAIVGAPGYAVTVKGFYAPNDGGGGNFHWDASSTLTPISGMIIQVPTVTVGRWVRDFYNTVDVKWLGAYGDSTHDDAPAINLACNNYKSVQLSTGTYRVASQISLNLPGLTLFSYSAQGRIISDPGVAKTIVIGYNMHDIIISQVYIKNQWTSTGAVGIYMVCDSAFDGVRGRVTYNIQVNGCEITGAPVGSMTAILGVSDNHQFGGTLHDFTFQGNYLHNISGTGIGMLGFGDTTWFYNINVYNNKIYNTGLSDSSSGFGMSFSGASYNINVVGNDMHSNVLIGIEFSGPRNSLMQNNTFSGSYSTFVGVRPNPFTVWSINNGPAGGRGVPGIGNRCIGNIVFDSVTSAPYYINQTGLYVSGNYVKCFSRGEFIDTVTNSTFIGNTTVKVEGTTAPVMNMSDSSRNNVFFGNSYIGPPSNDINQVILLQNSCQNNIFRGGTIAGNGSPSQSFQQDAGSHNNWLYEVYSLTAGIYFTFPFPQASSLTLSNDRIIDQTGLEKATPRVFQRIGLNYVAPLNTGDSMIVGTNIPLAKFTLQGTANQKVFNTDPTISSNSANQKLFVQQAGNGTSFIGYWVFDAGVSINGGDSMAIFYNSKYSTQTNPSGKLANWIDNKYAGGSMPNITNYGVVNIADGTTAGTYGYIFSSIANKANGGNFFINHLGTAWSDHLGSFTIGLNAPDTTVKLRVGGGQVAFDSTLTTKSARIVKNTTQSITAYTVTATDYTIFFTGGISTFTLPTPTSGRLLYIANQGTGTITLTPAVTTGSGVTSTSIAAGTNYEIEGDGTVWRKIN